MQIDLGGAGPCVAQELLNLVDAAPSISDVAAKSVPQLVRPGRRLHTGPPRQRRRQLVDRVRTHRRPDRCSEQVDQQEIAVLGAGHLGAFIRVRVHGLDGQEIYWNGPLPPGLRTGSVRGTICVTPASRRDVTPDRQDVTAR